MCGIQRGIIRKETNVQNQQNLSLGGEVEGRLIRGNWIMMGNEKVHSDDFVIDAIYQ